jgi:hypothetical protein
LKATESWFSRGKAAAKEDLRPGERVVGIAIVVFSLLMVSYFALHQVRSTGFFTAEFGTSEAILLYGLLILGIISAGLESVFTLRLQSRIFDTFGGLILAAIFTI